MIAFGLHYVCFPPENCFEERRPCEDRQNLPPLVASKPSNGAALYFLIFS